MTDEIDKIEVDCPNCTDPLSISPDQLGETYITCDNCSTQIDVALLKEAVRKKLDSIVKAPGE